jgi:capsular polysaccharide biosynthesis protein
MWLTNDCKAVLGGHKVTNKVVEELNLNMSPGSIGKNVVVTSQEESRILKLSYTDTNPKRAAAILNKLCEVAAPEIKTTLKITEFTQLDQAEVPTTPSKTNIARDTILAAAIGFVLSAAVLIVLFLLDDTIRNEDDVDRFLGLSTLTTIPISVDLSTDGKVSSKRKKKSQVWLKRK